jgi:hypothetical protein
VDGDGEQDSPQTEKAMVVPQVAPNPIFCETIDRVRLDRFSDVQGPNADHSLITQSSEQTPSSQPRSSYVPFTQIDPNPLAVVRLRCCNPKPHVLPFPPLHVLHAVHSLYAHGQSMSLQGLVSTVTFDGHTAPPFAAAITTVRVRVMVPSPHAIEQTEKAVHSLIKQSTGHRWVLHVW